MKTDFENLVCTKLKSVYTDFIDWLIFSGHWVFFSVNRYTDLKKETGVH